MLENKLWLVKFTSSTGAYGSGVISFDKGHVFGGDSSYYYYGSYELVDNNQVRAKVNIKQHSQGVSIFGAFTDFNLILSGSNQPNPILIGNVQEMPQMTVTASLQKLRDL